MISTEVPKISDMSFQSATGSSTAKLTAVFIPSSMSPSAIRVGAAADVAHDVAMLKSDRQFVVQIMTTTATLAAPYGTFAWRYVDDAYFSPEAPINLYMSATSPYGLSSSINGDSGVFIYWDAVMADTPSFMTTTGQIAAGDTYEFSIAQDFVNGEVGIFDSSDSNSMHQLVPCSGRGTCASETGKCQCLPGYSGEACQRSALGFWRVLFDTLRTHTYMHDAHLPCPPLSRSSCSDVPELVQRPRLVPDAASFCRVGQRAELGGLLRLRARPAVRLQV